MHGHGGQRHDPGRAAPSHRQPPPRLARPASVHAAQLRARVRLAGRRLTSRPAFRPRKSSTAPTTTELFAARRRPAACTSCVAATCWRQADVRRAAESARRRRDAQRVEGTVDNVSDVALWAHDRVRHRPHECPEPRARRLVGRRRARAPALELHAAVARSDLPGVASWHPRLCGHTSRRRSPSMVRPVARPRVRREPEDDQPATDCARACGGDGTTCFRYGEPAAGHVLRRDPARSAGAGRFDREWAWAPWGSSLRACMGHNDLRLVQIDGGLVARPRLCDGARGGFALGVGVEKRRRRARASARLPPPPAARRRARRLRRRPSAVRALDLSVARRQQLAQPLALARRAARRLARARRAPPRYVALPAAALAIGGEPRHRRLRRLQLAPPCAASASETHRRRRQPPPAACSRLERRRRRRALCFRRRDIRLRPRARPPPPARAATPPPPSPPRCASGGSARAASTRAWKAVAKLLATRSSAATAGGGGALRLGGGRAGARAPPTPLGAS